MKKVGIVLSGCGVFDGSEIHETTLVMFFLKQAGAELSFYAPDAPQMHVINHNIGEVASGETRNVLIESARIARGEVLPLSQISIDALDAIVLPGGFGAAKNLCTFGVDGPACTIIPELKDIILSAIAKGKVVGAMCIAPTVIACALKDSGLNPKLTIGTDEGTSAALAAMNAVPVSALVTEVVVDEKSKIVSTPAYMLAGNIADLGPGIEKFASEVMRLA